MDDRGLQRSTCHFHRATRLDLIDILNRFAHLRSHANQDAEQRGPRVVQSTATHEQMATRLRSGRDKPKRCRRNIARNQEVAGFGHLIAKNSRAPILFADGSDEKIIQHQFGMISAHSRLVHCRFSFCKKAGQEQCTFYLCTGDRQIVPAPFELYAMDFYGCGFVRPLRDNVRAHLAKRDDHAVHRAAGEGCTSHEPAIETLAGE